MSWHADTELLTRYARGDIDDAAAYSIEAHILACEECRAAVTVVSPRERVNSVWDAVRAEMDAPRPGVVERLMRRLRVPDHLARLLAATPSLSGSWLLAVAAALGFAVLASRSGGGNELPFLIVAPLLPLAGVATAYAPNIDPGYEMGVAAPLHGFKLMLIRALAVVGVTSVLAGIAALALPRVDAGAALWLLPALGLAAASLALSTWMSPVTAAATVASLWLALVLTGVARAVHAASTDSVAAFRPSGQAAFAVMFAIAALVLVMRREMVERIPRDRDV